MQPKNRMPNGGEIINKQAPVPTEEERAAADAKVAKVELTGPRVILRQLPAEEIQGAIFIPEKFRETPLQGIILVAGPNCCPAIKVGRRAAWGPGLGVALQLFGQTYMVLDETNLLAVWDNA